MARELEKAITGAIEASYYVAPETPGLLNDELVAVLAEAGYQPGEIGDALRTTLRNQVAGSANGYIFTREGLPISLTEHWLPFAEDPRDWKVFAFVHDRLKEIAKAKGLAHAKLSISAIYVEGESRRLDRHQVALAIHGLPLMNLAKLDATTGMLALTQQGAAWAALDAKLDSDAIHDSRPNLPRLVEAVSAARERRQPAVRWRQLRAELAALSDGDALKTDEIRVLDDVCAHFADTGEPASLDDIVRRLPDVEVCLIANGQLEQNQLLHVRPDARVVPSLLALHRYVDLFAPLFQLVNDVLHRGKELWDRKDTIVSLHGPRGLLQASGVGSSPDLARKQLALLIESMSLRPSIVPSAPGRVDLRDEIRKADTAKTLLAYQREHYSRRPPRVVLGPAPAQQQSLHPHGAGDFVPSAERNAPSSSNSAAIGSAALTVDALLLELQQLAQASATDIPELLRRAKVVAAKLLLDDVRAWIDHEINGYEPSVAVPTYRIIQSELRTRNPFHGWNPVAWPGPSKIQEHFASAEIRTPISEVVEISKGDGEPRVSLMQSEMDVLVPGNPDIARLPVARFFARTNFIGIAEAVRSRVLDWSLGVERERTRAPIPDTARKEKRMKRARPTMFIGSTVEALRVARAVQAELDHDMEITLWNQNVFEPGNATWIDLVTQARSEKYDFALLVLGAEDQITSRGTSANGPRDNVLLELGLFAGAVGPERTFFLIDRDNKPRIASDLAGITALAYGGNRSDGNLQSAVGPACEQIRRRVEKLNQSDAVSR